MQQRDDSAQTFKTPKVELRLFVAGMGPRSTRAIADLQRLCARYGEGCHIEIVDIYEQPGTAARAQIVAVPTLARERPLPKRRIVGTIANIEQVALSLGLTTDPLPGVA